LDLHLVNKGTIQTGNEADRLWRNDGSVFVAVDGEVPGVPDHMSDGGVWADFDQDGDLDLFLQEGTGPAFTSLGAPSLYYRNDGATGHWLRVDLENPSLGHTFVGTRVTAARIPGEDFRDRPSCTSVWDSMRSSTAWSSSGRTGKRSTAGM
jgi:hypothetical protein